MYCSSCGAEITPGQKFCNRCGQPQMQPRPQVQAQPQMQAQPQIPMQPKKKKNGLKALLVTGIALAFLGLFALAGYTAYNLISAIDTGMGVFESFEDPTNYGLVDFGDDEEPDTDTNTNTDPDLEEFTDDFYDGLGVDYTAYEYAYVYDLGDSVLIRPNSTVDDDTVIWNGKTLGGFCDFLDSEVLAPSQKVNRELLYSLVSIHVIDPAIVSDDHIFEILMKYCMIVCNEFGSTGVEIRNATFVKDTPNTYTYEISMNGNVSTWIIDYDNQKIMINNGEDEYLTGGEYGMFSEKTMTGWKYIIDKYFEIN